MESERDRFSLSRDLEEIADRIELAGETRRADELHDVARALRAKAAADEASREKRRPWSGLRPAAQVAALVTAWACVALLLLLLAD